MKLRWCESVTESDIRMHPNGYWYAVTDDGGYDAAGESVETALAGLVLAIEKALGNLRDA